MRSASFETAFLKFRVDEWKDEKYVSIIQSKTVVVAHEGQCLQYTVSLSGNVEYIDTSQCVCPQIEADTRVVYHLCELSGTVQGQNVAVRATYADIMIILLYHSRHLRDNVWMDVGH